MMLQLLDNIVRKGIVCINMAREQERSIARLFQVVLRRTKTSSLCAAARPARTSTSTSLLLLDRNLLHLHCKRG
jgi:hypothetical protein